MRLLLVTALALSLSAAFACGGSQPAPTTPPAEGDGGASAPNASNGSSAVPGEAKVAAGDAGAATAAQPDFDDLPPDQKAKVMRLKVVPNVGKVFREHDAKKYEKFDCATCHGPGKKKESPNKFLPKLAFKKDGVFKTGSDGKVTKGDPAMVKFMDEKVLPAMADAIGEHLKDPKTGKGFGCSGCHAVE